VLTLTLLIVLMITSQLPNLAIAARLVFLLQIVLLFNASPGKHQLTTMDGKRGSRSSIALKTLSQ
jgi:hypothetical protein